MSNEQKQETIIQLHAASVQVTGGLARLTPGDRESAEELVCALKEMLHTAETLAE